VKQTDYEWDLILRAAEALGVGRHARTKWKQRNMIPHCWRWGLVRHSGGEIRWEHFEAMDKARDAS